MLRLIAFLLLLAGPAAAQTPIGAEDGPHRQCSSGRFGPVQCIRAAHFAYDTCQAIQVFADQGALPRGFFARLIWQESRFDPNALSPADARGIAQFIDSTAQLRGLRDSLNPAEALEFSAQYLAEMTRKYGNVGLAAVGYNGGERRAEGLIARTGGLMPETIDYVQIITGLTAETWRDAPPEDHDFQLQGDMPFMEACLDLAQNRRFTAYPPPKQVVKPWGAQLAFGRSPAQARASYDRRTRACGFDRGAAPLDIVFVRNRVSGQQGYHMARVGADDSRSANAICIEARRRGCACAVYAN
ncbi:lytic transglycosylase domain-containing protein [Salipiger sp. IMCC34102]|uniref:lytic transglycosylase domain-containing protein n=1 Tax=Salipiger sp. IMCC34102 TaxID=2510647 RepID=UPI00101CCE2C|nr:lytic transglycosylase domain-containing protein [Salipiger sp. IMCC34102]RYH02380.1 lytic transglycosylase domain-containing protein [Salipiger sp. IMCC34102]